MEKLIELRKKAGLTQTEAANKIGVSLRTYQRYENGEILSEGKLENFKKLFGTQYGNMSYQGFKNDGRLKLLIIVGTRPEIIRLAAVINKTREYFDVVLAHTGQNYDYNLNGVFFKDLNINDKLP